MLIIRCAACKKKLWRYDKIGPGEVLRCHKDRIVKIYHAQIYEQRIQCPCGTIIGIDKGTFFRMIAKNCTHTGSKRH